MQPRPLKQFISICQSIGYMHKILGFSSDFSWFNTWRLVITPNLDGEVEGRLPDAGGDQARIAEPCP